MPLGVHFAIDEREVAALRGVAERKRPDHIGETIERRYLGDGNVPATPLSWLDFLLGRSGLESPPIPDSERRRYAAESDKAWDGMHRTLADGKMTWDGGTYPLNHVVLGGELLYTRDDYIISLKTPAQVRDIAAALETMTRERSRERYDAIDAASYDGELGDLDFDYTWDWFTSVRDLYSFAAQKGRYVLFTADQ